MPSNAPDASGGPQMGCDKWTFAGSDEGGHRVAAVGCEAARTERRVAADLTACRGTRFRGLAPESGSLPDPRGSSRTRSD
jgi:hypothetical protein